MYVHERGVMTAESMPDPVALVTSDQSLAASVREMSTEVGLAVNILDSAFAVDASGHQPNSLVLVDSRSWDFAEFSPSMGASGVMLAVEPGNSTWEKASICGFGEVIVWPEGSGLLAHRLGELAAASTAHAAVVAVVGGRGGCGATTLAVSLAVAAADQGVASVLVDADSHSHGLSRALGITDGEGLRWADFADIGEPLTAVGVRSQLAEADGFAVLTGPWGSRPASAVSRRYALNACELAFDLVVVDVPRYELASAGVSSTAFWVPLTTLEVRSLMTTAALLSEGVVNPSPAVVVRSDVGPVPQKSAKAVLGPGSPSWLRGSRGIRGAADFGDLGNAVGRGPIAELAQDLVSSLRNDRLGS